MTGTVGLSVLFYSFLLGIAHYHVGRARCDEGNREISKACTQHVFLWSHRAGGRRGHSDVTASDLLDWHRRLLLQAGEPNGQALGDGMPAGVHQRDAPGSRERDFPHSSRPGCSQVSHVPTS